MNPTILSKATFDASGLMSIGGAAFVRHMASPCRAGVLQEKGSYKVPIFFL